jgi:hypothetical protein
MTQTLNLRNHTKLNKSTPLANSLNSQLSTSSPTQPTECHVIIYSHYPSHPASPYPSSLHVHRCPPQPPSAVGPSPSPRLAFPPSATHLSASPPSHLPSVATSPSRLHKLPQVRASSPPCVATPPQLSAVPLLCLPSSFRHPSSTYNPHRQHPSSTSPRSNGALALPPLHASHLPFRICLLATFPFPFCLSATSPCRSAGRPPPAGIDTPLSFIFLLPDGWFCTQISL